MSLRATFLGLNKTPPLPVVPIAPAAPTGLTAVPTGAGRDDVLLSWGDPNSGLAQETGYEIEYDSGGGYAALTTTAADATTYTHTNPTLGGVTHSYRVRAVNSAGESAWATATCADLLLGLLAYWSLNSDGTDSVGTNHLTANGTITYGVGKMGSAAQFASGSHFSLASNSTVSRGDTDFTFSVWANMAGNNQAILAKDTNTVGEREYALFRIDDDLYWGIHRSAGGERATHQANNGFTAGDWHHLIAMHDAALNRIYAIRDGTSPTQGNTDGAMVGETAAPFTIGYRGGNNANGGAIQHAGLWNRVLSAANRASLYNAGSGLSYPFS